MKRKHSLTARVAAGILAATLLFTAQTPWNVKAESGSTDAVMAQEENVSETDAETTVPQENEDVNVPELEDGEDGGLEEIEPPQKLTVPQNLREEDGYIVWDEVKDAYGYYLRTYVDDSERQYPYYESSVELDRLCYEKKLDFGEYRFEICSFDESGNRSEWSDSITATYAPVLEAPAVRVSEEREETVLWDKVEGAVRYNIRVFKNDDDRTLYTTVYTSSGSYTCTSGWTSGDYWISVQAMSKDYDVSEWTEPVKVSHVKSAEVEREKLETPQNVRLDESGENILWDEVEGAGYYYVDISTYYTDSNGNRTGYSKWYHSNKPLFNNWKSYVHPFCEESTIMVYAYGSGFDSSSHSDALKVPLSTSRDESIDVPDRVWFEGSKLRWDDVECAGIWGSITVNGEIIDDNEWNTTYNAIGIGNNRFPAGKYDVELIVVDQNHNYNNKTYVFTIDTVPDETVWVPKMFYKFERLLWDYDRMRHDNTNIFWIRIKKGDTVVRLVDSRSEYFDGLPSLPNGDYTVETCVREYGYKIGAWSEPLEISKHDNGLFDKENEVSTEVEPSPDAEEIPAEDRITSITINPAFNMKHKEGDNVELDLTKIKIKANEIYDEEGLKRAEEALGEVIRGNTHYNLLDLTLLYDGEDFSNGYEGLVQVIIPIPVGHRDKTFTCYRLTEVDGEMVKEVIEGEQTDDSYIIYLEHFSEYVLVGNDEEEEHTHTYDANWMSDEDGHWRECECGEKLDEADHTYGDWEITKEATETEEGLRERSCEVCGYEQTESMPRLTPPTPPVEEHTHAFGSWSSDGDGHWKECECGEKSEEADHTYGDWEITKEATETEEGLQERSCEVCGYEQTESVPRLTPPTPPVEEHTHAFGENWLSDGDGHWKECECGEKSEETDHTYGDWEITKESTETEEGLRERSCEVCGYEQTESIPRLTPSEPSKPTEPSEPSKDEKKPVEFEDSDTRIKVTAPADAFDKADEIQFSATPVAEQTKGSQHAYDLAFTDKDGNKVQPKATVTVKIPVPEAFKDRTIYAYHVDDNGVYTEISCKVENKMVVFVASKFSTYIITGEKLNGDNTNDGSMNDSSANENTADAGYDGWAGVSAEQKAKLMKESREQNTTVAASPKTDDISGTGVVTLLLLSVVFMGAAVMTSKKKKQL